MPTLPAAERTSHRLLLLFPADLPADAELTADVDFELNRRHLAEFTAEGESFSMRHLVAIDYDAAKFSPADVFRRASSFGMSPVSFEPARAVARKGEVAPLERAWKDEESGEVFVVGVVYKAGEVDTHGEFMRGDAVRKLAHRFLERCRKVDADHDHDERAVVPVESYVREGDDGAEEWVVKARIDDPVLKRRVLLDADHEDSLNAFSFDAFVLKRRGARVEKTDDASPFDVLADLRGRAPAEIAAALEAVSKSETSAKAEDDTATELVDPDPRFLSLVRRGANRRRFAVVYKAEGHDPGARDPDPRAPSLADLPAQKSDADLALFGECASLDDALDRFGGLVAEAVEKGDDPSGIIERVQRAGVALVQRTGDELAAALGGTLPEVGAKFFRTRKRSDRVPSEQIAEAIATLKRAGAALAPEADMTKEEIAAAVKAGMQPLGDRIEALENRVAKAEGGNAPAADVGAIVREAVEKASAPILERLDAVEKRVEAVATSPATTPSTAAAEAARKAEEAQKAAADAWAAEDSIDFNRRK